jgi:hypothetical protein
MMSILQLGKVKHLHAVTPKMMFDEMLRLRRDRSVSWLSMTMLDSRRFRRDEPSQSFANFLQTLPIGV